MLERSADHIEQRAQLHEQALTEHAAAHTAQSEWLQRNGTNASVSLRR